MGRKKDGQTDGREETRMDGCVNVCMYVYMDG